MYFHHVEVRNPHDTQIHITYPAIINHRDPLSHFISPLNSQTNLPDAAKWHIKLPSLPLAILTGTLTLSPKGRTSHMVEI